MAIHEPEILEQILFRLPAKSIARFQCVSKAWKSLLSQPHFIKTHLNRIKQHPLQQQSLLLVCNQYLHSVKLENAHQVFDEMMMTPFLPTMLNLGDYRFSEDNIFDKIASCDGLIVLDVCNKLMLVNPTTREIKALPEPPYVLDRGHSNTIPGIGYDSLNDDYKVITISFYVDYHRCNDFFDDDDDEEEDDMVINVYSVKNGTWKTIGDSPLFDHKAVHAAGGVYCNGHIHWIAERNSEYYTVIAAFDVEQEKFCEVSLPSSVKARNSTKFSFGHLFVAGGCLCLLPHRMDYERECFVMKEYGVKESWTKVTIPDHDRLGIRPLCLLGEEQLVLLMPEHGTYEKLVLYNVKKRTFKEIKIQGFPDGLAIKAAFVESLISPHYVYRDEAANEE